MLIVSAVQLCIFNGRLYILLGRVKVLFIFILSLTHCTFLLEVCLCLVPNTSPRLMGKTAKIEKNVPSRSAFFGHQSIMWIPTKNFINFEKFKAQIWKTKGFFLWQVLNYQYINWKQGQIAWTFFKSSRQPYISLL